MRSMTLSRFYDELIAVINEIQECSGYFGVSADMRQFQHGENPKVVYTAWTQLKDETYLRGEGETPRLAIAALRERYAKLIEGPVELVL